MDQTCSDWFLFENITSCSHRHHIGTFEQLQLKFLVKICLKRVGFSITFWFSFIIHLNEHRINWIVRNVRERVAKKQKCWLFICTVRIYVQVINNNNNNMSRWLTRCGKKGWNERIFFFALWIYVSKFLKKSQGFLDLRCAHRAIGCLYLNILKSNVIVSKTETIRIFEVVASPVPKCWVLKLSCDYIYIYIYIYILKL